MMKANFVLALVFTFTLSGAFVAHADDPVWNVISEDYYTRMN